MARQHQSSGAAAEHGGVCTGIQTPREYDQETVSQRKCVYGTAFGANDGQAHPSRLIIALLGISTAL